MEIPVSTNTNSHFLDSEGERAIVCAMPLTPEQLAEQAMNLPTDSRARLADLLVESLDAAELTAIDRAWAVEARRRRDEVRSGSVTTISASEAFRKVRDSLKR
jgi:putative addiction module component